MSLLVGKLSWMIRGSAFKLHILSEFIQLFIRFCINMFSFLSDRLLNPSPTSKKIPCTYLCNILAVIHHIYDEIMYEVLLNLWLIHTSHPIHVNYSDNILNHNEHYFKLGCWLAPCGRVPLEQLMVSQLSKKFPTFYGTKWFIATFTRACHWTLI
jgi:hypothetical protein